MNPEADKVTETDYEADINNPKDECKHDYVVLYRDIEDEAGMDDKANQNLVCNKCNDIKNFYQFVKESIEKAIAEERRKWAETEAVSMNEAFDEGKIIGIAEERKKCEKECKKNQAAR